MNWTSVKDAPPPKDKLLLVKIDEINYTEIYLIYWENHIYKNKDYGFWKSQCGCMNAEECLIGEILEWTVIDE